MHADALRCLGSAIPHAQASCGGLDTKGRAQRLALSQKVPHGRTLDGAVLDGQQPGTSDVSVLDFGGNGMDRVTTGPVLQGMCW